MPLCEKRFGRPDHVDQHLRLGHAKDKDYIKHCRTLRKRAPAGSSGPAASTTPTTAAAAGDVGTLNGPSGYAFGPQASGGSGGGPLLQGTGYAHTPNMPRFYGGDGEFFSGGSPATCYPVGPLTTAPAGVLDGRHAAYQLATASPFASHQGGYVAAAVAAGNMAYYPQASLPIYPISAGYLPSTGVTGHCASCGVATQEGTSFPPPLPAQFQFVASQVGFSAGTTWDATSHDGLAGYPGTNGVTQATNGGYSAHNSHGNITTTTYDDMLDQFEEDVSQDFNIDDMDLDYDEMGFQG